MKDIVKGIAIIVGVGLIEGAAVMVGMRAANKVMNFVAGKATLGKIEVDMNDKKEG